jgi:hypothetical protein
MAVVPKVITGVRPKLLATDATTTTKLVDAVWPLAEECWHQKWDQRPSSCQVLERLNLTASRWSVPELLPEATNSVLWSSLTIILVQVLVARFHDLCLFEWIHVELKSRLLIPTTGSQIFSTELNVNCRKLLFRWELFFLSSFPAF